MKKIVFVILASLAALSLSASSTSCITLNIDGVGDSGKVTTKEFHLDDTYYTELEVSGNIRVRFVDSPDGKGTITGGENIIDRIVISKRGDEITIGNKSLTLSWGSDAPVIELPASSAQKLSIELDGASSLVGRVDLVELDVDLEGASACLIEGRADRCEVDASGASKFRGYGLECRSAELDASGASSIELTVTENLEAEASGASSISYKGAPRYVRDYARGMSTIKRVR